MVSKLCVAALARLEISSTSCSTAWMDSFPASAASLLPPELAMDEPWSALEVAPDFPFFPLLFALGGAAEAIAPALPDGAPLAEVLASADGAVPVLDAGVVLASAGGGAEPSEALVASGVVFPDGAPEFVFGAPLAAVDGV